MNTKGCLTNSCSYGHRTVWKAV